VNAGELRYDLNRSGLWAGDTRGGGKALAAALAAGAIELISWLTFKAGSAALKGAKAAAKGAQAAARVGARAARGAVNLVKRGANFLIKGSKVLLRGAGDAIGRAVKSLRELGEKLLAKTKFKGFRFKIEGKRWALEGRINPWVLLATGEEKHRRVGVLRWSRGLGDVPGHDDESDGLAPAKIAARLVERLATLLGDPLEVAAGKPAMRAEVQVRELEQHQRRDQVGAGSGILRHRPPSERVSHAPQRKVVFGAGTRVRGAVGAMRWHGRSARDAPIPG
jgi:hypothetical protein